MQDLVYRIPFWKKVRAFPYERVLRALKYVVLAVMVIGLPLLSAFSGVLTPWFCKLLCPSGTLFAGIPLVIENPALGSQIGFLFWWKVGVLLALLLLSLLISRPFCRYLCPLGAIYGMLNRISLVHLRYESEKCVDCGKCVSVCAMGVDPRTQFNSAECIRCGRCQKICPTDALHVRFGLRGKE